VYDFDRSIYVLPFSVIGANRLGDIGLNSCSVIIRADHTDQETIGCLLDRLRRQRGIDGIEIILVDSSPPTRPVSLPRCERLIVEKLPRERFSYGRALQDPPLKTWRGEAGNSDKAQQAFHHRARCNSEARFGRYSAEMEKELVGAA